MKNIIALDTDVIVIAAGGQTPIERGRERVHQMISDHMGRGDHIYIPAPAFAECCHTIDDVTLSRLRIEAFGAAAARIANRITKAVREAASETKGDKQPTRQELKVDAMILATAEAMRADILYIGADLWFLSAREQAKLRVEVRELPPYIPQPQRLPMMDD